MYIYILYIYIQCLNWIKGGAGAGVWHTVFHKITESLFLLHTHEINTQYYKLLSLFTIFNQHQAELKKSRRRAKLKSRSGAPVRSPSI